MRGKAVKDSNALWQCYPRLYIGTHKIEPHPKVWIYYLCDKGKVLTSGNAPAERESRMLYAFAATGPPCALQPKDFSMVDGLNFMDLDSKIACSFGTSNDLSVLREILFGLYTAQNPLQEPVMSRHNENALNDNGTVAIRQFLTTPAKNKSLKSSSTAVGRLSTTKAPAMQGYEEEEKDKKSPAQYLDFDDESGFRSERLPTTQYVNRKAATPNLFIDRNGSPLKRNIESSTPIGPKLGTVCVSKPRTVPLESAFLGDEDKATFPMARPETSQRMASRNPELSQEHLQRIVPVSKLHTLARKASTSTPIGQRPVLASISPVEQRHVLASTTPKAGSLLQAPKVIDIPSTPLKRSIKEVDSETPSSVKRIKTTALQRLPTPTFDRTCGAPSPLLHNLSQAISLVSKHISPELSFTESDIDNYFDQWCTNQLKVSDSNFQDIAWLILQKLHQVFPGLELDYNIFFTGTVLQIMRPEGPFGDSRIRAAIDAAKDKADRERTREIEAQMSNESEQAITEKPSTPVPTSIRSHKDSPPAATPPTGPEENFHHNQLPLPIQPSPALEVDNSVDADLLHVPVPPKTLRGSGSGSKSRPSGSKYSGNSFMPRQSGPSLGSSKIKIPKHISKLPDSRIKAAGTPSNLRADVSFTTGTPSCMSRSQRDGTSDYATKALDNRRPEVLRFTAETKDLYASRR